MSQNVTKIAPFAWSKVKERAAELVAEDKLTDDQIAELSGCERRTLARWKTHPEFAARVDAVVADFCATVRKHGIAILERRVAALDDRWKRMQQVIEERAKDVQVSGHAGGETGLIVRRETPTKFGEIVEYSVDTGLLSELRAHEQQAAKELGQWVDKAETKANVTIKPPVDLESLSIEELAALHDISRKLDSSRSGDSKPAV